MTTLVTIWDFPFNDGDLVDWTVVSGNSSFVSIEGGILKLGNYATSTGNRIMLVNNDLYPFDPSKLYRFEVEVRNPYVENPLYPGSGITTGGISVGFLGYAADGTTLISTSQDSNILLFHAHAVFELSISAYSSGTGSAYLDQTRRFVGRTLGHSIINGGDGTWGQRIEDTEEQFYYEELSIQPEVASQGVAFIKPVIYCNYQYAFSGVERIGQWYVSNYKLQTMEYNLLYDSPSSIYTITPSSYSISRGNSVIIAISVTDATDGTLFYEVVATSANCTPFDFYGPSGYYLPNGIVNILAGVGEINIPTSLDLYGDIGITTDTFKVIVRKQSPIGEIVVETTDITLVALGTQFNLVRSRTEVSEIYSPPTPIYDGLGSIIGFIDGPSVVTIRVYCNQKPIGTSVPFVMTGIQAADIQEMRINNTVVPVALSGSFSLIQYSGSNNYSDLRLFMAEDGLVEPTERCTLTLQDPGGTLNMETPYPSTYFDIVGYEIVNDYGLQTFSSSGQLVFSADVMSFLTVQRGTATVSNTLSSGNTTQDITVTGLVPDENWIVSLHLPAFDVSYKIWADVYSGFFRINFTRDTSLGTPPSSINISYSVLRV